MLTCSIVYINNFTSLVTKGYHGCKFFGPSLKAKWSNQLALLSMEGLLLRYLAWIYRSEHVA
jgi:hypothetical protein